MTVIIPKFRFSIFGLSCGVRPDMIRAVFEEQKAFYLSGRTRPLDFRLRGLRQLRHALQAREAPLLSALRQDLGKSAVEAYTSELGLVLREIDLTLRSLRHWTRPQPHKTSRLDWPARSRLYPDPRGVVLIMGPWNYPLQLVLMPLVGALAAGNCAIVKPSEFAPHTAAAVEALLNDIFPRAYCHVVPGDARAAADFLALPWDHIFFTGSTRVGRLVMQAAARWPATVTLELGGKNPCIVLADSPPEITAERIVWGKFINAGQTCGAPDHCYVERRALDRLVEALKRALIRFYGPDPSQSPDYGRIIHPVHLDRLVGYLRQGRVVVGGQYHAPDRYLAPTLLVDVPEDSPVMQEEIFGPVLPLLPFDNFNDLLQTLRTRPQPLAAYVFTRNRVARAKALTGIAAGGLAFNDTMSHIATPHLPLGGIGASGQGRYHGRASFDCFTHYKSVLAKGFAFPSRLKYPPYTTPLAFIKKAYKWLV
jgi:aldehyde dehydrogenase (NAD+)